MGRQTITRDGVELSVETGTGSILKVEHDAGKRNAQVFIRADHLKDPIRGWLDTHDTDLLAKLNKAQAELAGRISYRIEVTRDKAVDAGLPWSEVPQRERFRRLVGLADQHHLADLIPDLLPVTVGAPANSGATTANSGASGPAAAQDAPTPPKTPPPAHSPAGGRVCVSCKEALAGRPVKKVPGGYVHTDTPCLEAPFADTPATDGDAGDGKSVITAGLEATAQRAAHRGDGVATPEELDRMAAKADEVAAEAGLHRCQVCNLAMQPEHVAEHEATPAHQGKARQAEQAADLAKRREAADAQRGHLQAQATQFDDAPQPVKLAPVPLPTPRGKVAEGRPWEEFNSDGSLNMGSYRMQANIACVNWAQRLLVERARVVAGETGAQATVDPAQLRTLARELLKLSDRIQASIRDDGRYDRMDNSHTRARSALSTALNVYPVPFGADDELKAQWRDQVVAWAVMLVNVAVELDQ